MTAARRPSPAYYYASVAAWLGMVALAIGIYGTIQAAAGRDAMSAINVAGSAALIFGLLVSYVMRLAFAPSVTPERQRQVTMVVRIVYGLEVAAAVIGSIYVFGSAAATSGTQTFMIIGDLLQIGTLLWIFRYADG